MSALRLKCKNCGSFAIARDAWVTWNYDKKDWEVLAVYDHMQCLECDSERIEEYEHAETA